MVMMWEPASMKTGFQCLSIMILLLQMAHAKAVLAYREMGGKGEIGASFAYTPSYAIDCKPINAMAKRDYDELKNFWWMDVYASKYQAFLFPPLI